MDFQEAMQNAVAGKAFRGFPELGDTRVRDRYIFPTFKPKFPIQFGSSTKAFTIGSCFARHIEEVLSAARVQLPTLEFAVSQDEWPGRANALLNEFNPGTISQRILFALENRPWLPETIVPSGTDTVADLLLVGSNVSLQRANERRIEVDRVYSHLTTSDVVIITLGLTETWFDEDVKLYLNRMPPHAFAIKNPTRFTFKQLDVYESMPLLETAMDALEQKKIKVILTVSPVPLSATFSGRDCVVANEFSKSVLRVCAERLSRRMNIDYFPSYEIARSGGLESYDADHVHVKNSLVKEITEYMTSSYASSPS